MKRKAPASKLRNARKSFKIANDTNSIQIEELNKFSSSLLQNHVLRNERLVREAIEQKNVVIKDLKNVNKQLECELKDFESILKQRDSQIEKLEIEFEIKTQNKDLDKPSVMRRNVSALESLKVDKRFRKYKELKMKSRSKDNDIVMSENEKRDLRKHIEAKNEIIMMKDVEIREFDRKLKDSQLISSPFQALSEKYKAVKDVLELKEKEIDRWKLKIVERVKDIELLKHENDEIGKESLKQEIEIQSKYDIIKIKDAENKDICQSLAGERTKFIELRNLNIRYREELEMKEKTFHKDNIELIETKDAEIAKRRLEFNKYLEDIAVIEKQIETLDTDVAAKDELIIEKDVNIYNLDKALKAEQSKSSTLLVSLSQKEEIIRSKTEETAELHNNMKEEQTKSVSMYDKTINLKEKLKLSLEKLTEKITENENMESKLADRNSKFVQIEENYKIIKLKNNELWDLQKQLDKERTKTASMKSKCIYFEEQLKTKDNYKVDGISNIQTQLNEESIKTNIRLAEKDEELSQMSQILLEKDQEVKSVQTSIEKVEEKLHIDFQSMISAKNEKIKELEEWKNFYCKENQVLRKRGIEKKNTRPLWNSTNIEIFKL